MKRVLIAGCGDVGTALGMALLAEGHEVHGLRRNVSLLPQGIRPVAADLNDPETLKQLPQVDVVFYTAAATEGSESAYRRAYMEGVAHLMRALLDDDQKIQRFIMIGSTSVYAQSDGSWVDEETATEPDSFRGRILLEGERLVKDGPFDGVVARFSGIYGPGRYRMFRAIASGAVADESDGEQYTNRIHRDDGVRALIHLMNLEQCQDTYLITDGEAPPQSEVVAYLRQLLQDHSIGIVDSDKTLPSRGGNKRCSNKRLLDSGFSLRYPSYRDGYRDLITDWLQV